MADQSSSPSEEVKRLYEEAESATARALEESVSRPSFGELLARVTENAVALTKIGTDVFDLMLRNLRLAGRQDVTRLARQLARTEDKLELVLQEVERLNDRLEADRSSSGRSRSGGSRRTGSANGRGSGGARRSSGTRSSR
ncbi:MAG: hypothetical protein JOZ73_00925 [Solirubrobacterales bacterium]|nr:hypothetical protein [Solirubrobacterales bacterium]